MLNRLFAVIDRFFDLLEGARGLPILIGLLLVIVSLIGQFSAPLAFLTEGNWLLHVGVILGLGGLLLGEAV
jgi:hypothetical protein